jgi:hypothetical protein
MKNIYQRLMESGIESLINSIHGDFSDLYVLVSPESTVIIEAWQDDMEGAELPALVKTITDSTGALAFEIYAQYQPFIDDVLSRTDKRPKWHTNSQKKELGYE